MPASTTSLILQDFSLHHWPVSPSTTSSLESHCLPLYLLLGLDQLLSHLVLGPLVVAFWRGIWLHSALWLDTHLCGGDLLLSNGLAVAAGVIGCSLVHVFQEEVRVAARTPGTVRYILTARIFSIWWGSFFVILWKGLWEGISFYFLGGILSLSFSCKCLAMGLLSMAFTGTCRSGVGCPIGISPDLTPSHFTATTLLSSGPADGWLCRVADGFLSNLVTVQAVLAWYATWTIQDVLLEDEEWLGLSHLTSALISTIGGFLLSLFLLVVQAPLLQLCHLRSQSPQSAPLLLASQLATTLATLLSLISGYTSFRGVWYLWDIFYLPGHPTASAVTGAVIGGGGLLIVGGVACLHAGVYWDGVVKNPITVPYYYMSYYYIQRRQIKNAQHLDLQDQETHQLNTGVGPPSG